MTKVVMVLQGMPDGSSTPYDGQFLKAMDFEAYNGQGEITTTRDGDEAMKFDSIVAAMDFYKTQPKNQLLRADGKPNRPLTASNWEFRMVED